MTPALQKIVEAMALEFERQLAEDRAKPWDKGGLVKAAEASRRFDPGAPGHGDVESIYVMGRFNLEKVARAGLEAIFNQGFADRDEMVDAIVAILEEKPRSPLDRDIAK